jgi:homoserine O-acetyltransferase
MQFGMNGDPKVQAQWNKPINNDPVATTNARGTVAFATSRPNTQTTQIFINTNANGNSFLDKQGFTAFGQVISGMDVVDHIYDVYGKTLNQAMIRSTGNEYLKFNYPKLTYIVMVTSKK